MIKKFLWIMAGCIAAVGTAGMGIECWYLYKANRRYVRLLTRLSKSSEGNADYHPHTSEEWEQSPKRDEAWDYAHSSCISSSEA